MVILLQRIAFLSTALVVTPVGLAQVSPTTQAQIVGNSGPVVTGNSVTGNLTVVVAEQDARYRRSLTGTSTPTPEAVTRDERRMFLDALQREPAFADILLRLLGSVGTLDVPAAEKMLDEAAIKGHPLALLLRGVVYQNGWWGERNVDKAKSAYFRAADLGAPGAQLLVQANLYEGTNGYPRDRKRSTSYLHKLSQNEFALPSLRADASLWLSNRYWNGDEHPKDRCESMRYLSLATEMGQPQAMLNMGFAREKGEGCLPISFEDAFKWFQRAADAGSIDAREQVGRMLFYGRGTGRDFAGALRYFEESETSYSDSMAAWIYSKGLHNPQNVPDYRKGFTLARRAADAGNVFSMRNVGLMYLYGLGVEQNLSEAFRWYGKAAESGSTEAFLHQVQLLLGSCVGLERMPEWKKALEDVVAKPETLLADRERARSELGRALAFGLGGVQKDERRAREMLRQSCNSSEAQGCSVLLLLEPTAKNEQVAIQAERKVSPDYQYQTEGTLCALRLIKHSSSPDYFP